MGSSLFSLLCMGWIMNQPWYHAGLRFKCTGCGKCCTGAPGYVWVSPEEAQKIADHLQVSLEDFLRRYTRKVNGHLSLTEDPTSFDCVFLRGKQCSIYEVRPEQCRTYPWWKENVKSPQSWEEEAVRCEGINHKEAPVISLNVIQKTME